MCGHGPGSSLLLPGRSVTFDLSERLWAVALRVKRGSPAYAGEGGLQEVK